MRTCNIKHRIIKSVCHVHKNSQHQCDVHYTKIVIDIFVTYIGDKIIKLMLLDREKPTLSAHKRINARRSLVAKMAKPKVHFADNSGSWSQRKTEGIIGKRRSRSISPAIFVLIS